MSLDQYLKKHIADSKTCVNYTKIGNAELGVFGNKYFIGDDDVTEFQKVYKKHVFENKKEAYLTEKQLEIGKILIDLDFRYNDDIEERQHTKEHIQDFIEMCVAGLYDIFKEIDNKTISFYIFEKDNVNLCEDKTKDGVHIIINILCDYATKMIIREYIVTNISDIWEDLPITNSWKDVVDEGVIKGHVNWQLYGSRKPGNEQYKLKYIFETMVDNEGSIDIKDVDILKIDFNKYFPYLCARNCDNCHTFKLDDKFQSDYEKFNKEFQYKKTKSLRVKSKSSCKSVDEISNQDDLDALLNDLFNDTNTNYEIKETHNYLMTLPSDFYGSGSYDKWIRVGWALKNTNERLKLSWLKFSSQSDDFDFMCNDVLEYWDNFDRYNREGLSNKSIIYWSKTYAYEDYCKVYKKTVDYYIYYSFKSNTETDLANALHNMFKSQYVCVSIKDNIWFEFSNNKWYKIDSGAALRMKISTEMYSQYTTKLIQFQTMSEATQNNMAVSADSSKSDAQDKGNDLNHYENKIMETYKENTSDSFGDYKKKMNDMVATCKMLKKTTIKNNIMRECRDLFYDKDFMNKLDKDPYLLGCNNYIIDFNEKIYRKGKHEDYVSKTTNLNYFPMSYYKKQCPQVIDDINEFINQLFPNEELRKYMWEHLASTLLGTNENQTFNIYTGSGANGKSKLVELMTLVLGEYKGTVPISLVTQKRTNIGSTSSEIYNLIGTRYAVMQEPSKGDKINEGIMKELTGGDPIQCRALFKDSVTFVPQFKLVVCTNTLFDIVSNDDGTWRRLRKVDFESKFTNKPFEDPQFPVEDYPHQFMIDTKIDEKFKAWAPVLLSMLVDIAFETKGKVKDVGPVLEATEKYRKEQDVFLEFHDAIIEPRPHKNGYGVKNRDVMNKFKDWFQKIYSTKVMPNGKEVQKYFEKRYGPYPATGWLCISFKTEYDNTLDEHFT